MPRVLVLVLDREHDEDRDGALGARQLDEPRHEVDALEHERPALLERALGRGAHADVDVARLRHEAEVERVAGLGERVSRLEARVVDRRHEVAREEGAHRLADEVGRRDARDPEAVGDLGRDRRLPGSRRPADQEDDWDLQLAQLLVAAEAAGGLCAFVLAEHVAGELFEPLEVDRLLPALRQVHLDALREVVGP